MTVRLLPISGHARTGSSRWPLRFTTVVENRASCQVGVGCRRTEARQSDPRAGAGEIQQREVNLVAATPPPQREDEPCDGGNRGSLVPGPACRRGRQGQAGALTPYAQARAGP